MKAVVALLAWAFASATAPAETYEDEDETYPAHYRGSWAPTLASCSAEFGQGVITIGRTKIWSYEADSKLLKITPEFLFTGPNGVDAASVHAIVAERGETEVGIAKLRLTLAGGKLYTSRLDEVSDDEQWNFGNVKCPDRSRP